MRRCTSWLIGLLLTGVSLCGADRPNWRLPLRDLVSLQVEEELVLVGLRHEFWCLNLEDGHLLWKRPVRTVDSRRGNSHVHALTNQGCLLAMEARSGRLTWTSSVCEGRTARKLHGPFQTARHLLFVLDLDPSHARLVALDPFDGSLAWARDLEGAVQGTPSLTESGLVVGTPLGVQMLGVEDGTTLWQWKAPAPLTWMEVPDQRVVCWMQGLRRGLPSEMVALDPGTGKPAWRLQSPSSCRLPRWVNALPEGPGIAALEPKAGTVAWRLKVPGMLALHALGGTFLVEQPRNTWASVAPDRPPLTRRFRQEVVWIRPPWLLARNPQTESISWLDPGTFTPQGKLEPGGHVEEVWGTPSGILVLQVDDEIPGHSLGWFPIPAAASH